MSKPIRKKKYGDDWAMFLPSVSQMYVLAHAKGWGRQPIDMKMLDFIDPTKADHFHYPYALYSAGHAHLDPTKSNEREPMIQKRNREHTIMVGDSGGFQAATGVLDFDWSDPMGQKAIDKRIELLRWLEHTSDYSMVLDWPAWAIDTGRLPQTLMVCDPTTSPLEVTNDPFGNCLKGTVWNNEFFIKNRNPGATKFLNVLQGRSIEEAYTWYDAVTPFSSVEKYGERAFEGWALGGSTGGDPSLTMRLLVKLRDDGHLNGDDRWIHVLGRSRLSTAVYLTMLNQAMKRHINENIQISYDAASAFLYAVNGNYVVDYAVNTKQLNLISTDLPMHERYIGSSEKLIYNGVSAERLADPNHCKSKIGEILTMGDIILPPDEKSKKPYRMDTASYYYIMAHNVQCQVQAIEYASSKATADDAADHLPPIFIEFKDFVNRLFTTETPFSLIEKEANKFRDLISGERAGVSALENHELFPKTAGIESIAVDNRAEKRKKAAKPVKPTMTSCLDDLIG